MDTDPIVPADLAGRLTPLPDANVAFDSEPQPAGLDAAAADVIRRLRGLVQRLDQRRADEQARIARDLHDRLGQSLSLARILVHRTAAVMAAGEARAALDDALTEIDAAIRAARDMSGALRPPLLDTFGVGAALDALVTRVASAHGLVPTLELQDFPLPIDDARVLYQIAQEALTNIVRHAHASRVTARLALRPDGVVLEIDDDGVGASDAATRGAEQLGILGMQEAMRGRGGTLAVRPRSGGGTRVTATLPSPMVP